MEAIAAFLILFSLLCFLSWLFGHGMGAMTSDSTLVKTAEDSKDADLIQVKQSFGQKHKQAIQDVEINAMEVQQARNDEEERNRLHHLHDIDMAQRDREYEESVQSANAYQASQPWEN
jgi:hypothetical protein